MNGEKAGTEALGTIKGSEVVAPARTSMVLVDAGC